MSQGEDKNNGSDNETLTISQKYKLEHQLLKISAERNENDEDDEKEEGEENDIKYKKSASNLNGRKHFWPWPKTPPSTPLATPRRPLKQSISSTETVSLPSTPSSTPARWSSQQSNSCAKKSVKFNRVEVFLFDRCQGFTSIPSAPESKLPSVSIGMSYKHTEAESFNSIDDYMRDKRKADIQKLEAYFHSKLGELETQNQRAAEKSLFSANNTTAATQKKGPTGRKKQTPTKCVPVLSTEDLISTDPDLTRINAILQNKDFYETNVDAHLEVNADIMCPILSTKQRLELLENLELEIDLNESAEIKSINESREVCGCLCGKFNLVCGDPDNDMCTCVQNGIMCQLDRFRYPCCCTVKKCKNPLGFKKFNCARVIEHYKNVLHTNVDERLEIEALQKAVEEKLERAEEKEELKKSQIKNDTTSSTRKRKRKASVSPKKRKKQQTMTLAKELGYSDEDDGEVGVDNKDRVVEIKFAVCEKNEEFNEIIESHVINRGDTDSIVTSDNSKDDVSVSVENSDGDRSLTILVENCVN